APIVGCANEDQSTRRSDRPADARPSRALAPRGQLLGDPERDLPDDPAACNADRGELAPRRLLARPGTAGCVVPAKAAEGACCTHVPIAPLGGTAVLGRRLDPADPSLV